MDESKPAGGKITVKDSIEREHAVHNKAFLDVVNDLTARLMAVCPDRKLKRYIRGEFGRLSLRSGLFSKEDLLQVDVHRFLFPDVPTSLFLSVKDPRAMCVAEEIAAKYKGTYTEITIYRDWA